MLFRSGRKPEWWNPFDGEATAAEYQIKNGRSNLTVSLAPYESKILVFSGIVRAGEPAPAARRSSTPLPVPIDISSDWRVTFLGTGQTVTMQHLRSWTEDEATRFYSGRALYEKVVQVSPSFLSQAAKVLLDFGAGVAVEPAAQETPGMHALLDGPVREAAVVMLNGKRAGVVWHPPYELDIKADLRVGQNRLQITVGNLAINEISGYAAPDYKLLNLRYGERFLPQDMKELRPLPSGIVRPVILRAE